MKWYADQVIETCSPY